MRPHLPSAILAVSVLSACGGKAATVAPPLAGVQDAATDTQVEPDQQAPDASSDTGLLDGISEPEVDAGPDVVEASQDAPHDVPEELPEHQYPLALENGFRPVVQIQRRKYGYTPILRALSAVLKSEHFWNTSRPPWFASDVRFAIESASPFSSTFSSSMGASRRAGASTRPLGCASVSLERVALRRGAGSSSVIDGSISGSA